MPSHTHGRLPLFPERLLLSVHASSLSLLVIVHDISLPTHPTFAFASFSIHPDDIYKASTRLSSDVHGGFKEHATLEINGGLTREHKGHSSSSQLLQVMNGESSEGMASSFYSQSEGPLVEGYKYVQIEELVTPLTVPLTLHSNQIMVSSHWISETCHATHDSGTLKVDTTLESGQRASVFWTLLTEGQQLSNAFYADDMAHGPNNGAVAVIWSVADANDDELLVMSNVGQNKNEYRLLQTQRYTPLSNVSVEEPDNGHAWDNSKKAALDFLPSSAEDWTVVPDTRKRLVWQDPLFPDHPISKTGFTSSYRVLVTASIGPGREEEGILAVLPHPIPTGDLGEIRLFKEVKEGGSGQSSSLGEIMLFKEVKEDGSGQSSSLGHGMLS